MFLRRTAAVSLSGYLFFGSSVDIGSKAVQASNSSSPCLGWSVPTLHAPIMLIYAASLMTAFSIPTQPQLRVWKMACL